MRNFTKTAVFAVTAAMLISGCGSDPAETTAVTENVTTTTTAEITTTAASVATTAATTTTASGTEDTRPVLGDTIIGMDGVTVDRPVEQIGKLGAAFDTLIFYRESTGLIFNDDSYHNQKSEWKKAVPGDNFGTLTVSSVSAVYDPIYGQNTEDHSLGEYYAWSHRVMFLDGTVTLSGILYAEANEEAFWGKSLFFRPTARSLAEKNFPTLRPISRCLPSVPYYKVNTYEDTQDFYLGNIDNFSDIIDWTLYTDENNIIEVYAEIELSDIKISYDTATGASNEGEAASAKIISVNGISVSEDSH